MEIRLFRRDSDRDEWTKNEYLDLTFEALPRVGDIIETGSAGGHQYVWRVQHVVHRPNQDNGSPKVCIYATREDPPDFVFKTLDLY